MVLFLRDLTAKEREAIERLAHSRTASARLVERARIVGYAAQGRSVTEIAALLNLNRKTVRQWLNRFNESGVAGIEDQSRSGRPLAIPSDQLREIVMTALTPPATLGLGFERWTLGNLESYLRLEKGISITAKRVARLLSTHGIRLRQPKR